MSTKDKKNTKPSLINMPSKPKTTDTLVVVSDKPVFDEIKAVAEAENNLDASQITFRKKMIAEGLKNGKLTQAQFDELNTLVDSKAANKKSTKKGKTEEKPKEEPKVDHEALLKAAIASYPATFGLLGHKGVFRVSAPASFVSEGRLMIYTQKQQTDGTWLDFAKEEHSAAQAQIVELKEEPKTETKKKGSEKAKDAPTGKEKPKDDPKVDPKVETPKKGKKAKTRYCVVDSENTMVNEDTYATEEEAQEAIAGIAKSLKVKKAALSVGIAPEDTTPVIVEELKINPEPKEEAPKKKKKASEEAKETAPKTTETAHFHVSLFTNFANERHSVKTRKQSDLIVDRLEKRLATENGFQFEDSPDDPGVWVVQRDAFVGKDRNKVVGAIFVDECCKRCRDVQ